MSAKVGATTDNESSRHAATPARQIVPNQISGPPGSERPPRLLFATVAALAFVLLLGGSVVTVKALSPYSATLRSWTQGDPPKIECWNGMVIESGASCPPISHKGLLWVFPSSPDYNSCDKGAPHTEYGELETYTCSWADLTDLSGTYGTYATVSRWTSAQDAVNYFSPAMLSATKNETSTGLSWWSPGPNGAKTPGYAYVYKGEPYSVLILGPSEDLKLAMSRVTPRPSTEVDMGGVDSPDQDR